MSKTLAILIPARGGSKRIKDKNLQKIGGETLVARAVRHALMLTDLVFVSTDSEAIVQETLDAGATWMRRPPELATDDHSLPKSQYMAILRHHVEAGHLEADYYGLMNCSVPFPDMEVLQRWVPDLMTGNVPSAFAAYPFKGFLYETFEGRDRRGEFIALSIPINRRWDERPLSQQRKFWKESGEFYLRRSDQIDQPDQVDYMSRIIQVRQSPEIDTPEELEKCRALSAK